MKDIILDTQYIQSGVEKWSCAELKWRILRRDGAGNASY